MSKLIPLTELPLGASATIGALNCANLNRRRLQDLGLTDGAAIAAAFESPFGDPVAYAIRGALIALRSEEACTVMVRLMD